MKPNFPKARKVCLDQDIAKEVFLCDRIEGPADEPCCFQFRRCELLAYFVHDL